MDEDFYTVQEAARILRTTERTAGSFCHGLPFRSPPSLASKRAKVRCAVSEGRGRLREPKEHGWTANTPVAANTPR